MIVLDTHAAVWWTLEPERLGRAIGGRLAREERIGIPAIVFWEASALVRKCRLDLTIPVGDWASKLLEIPRVEVLPLTAEIALLADVLEMHPDPADRFIVATAQIHRAWLGTKDRLLSELGFLRTVW